MPDSIERLSSGILDSGVDWMTVTAQGPDERTGLGVLSRRLAREVKDKGNELLPWAFSGYAGFKTRGLQWGERHDSTIVRLSGPTARWEWWDFYQLCEAVTRVDWQVTYRSSVDPQRRVLDHHKAAKRKWHGRKDGPTVTIIADDRGGATLYLGKRASRIMMRVYNKFAESNDEHYRGCVRYEVELKERMAQSMMVQLTRGGMPQALIISSVHEMMSVRGVSPPWDPGGPPLTQDSEPISATDVARKRRWLRAQVRPTIDFLVEHVGMAAIAEDLGLNAFADAGLDYYRPWSRWTNNKEGA